MRRQVSRLGLSVTETDPEQPIDPRPATAVIVLDADGISIKSDVTPALKANLPVIALIGTDAQPAEMAFGTQTRAFSHQAAAAGRTLCCTGGRVRLYAATKRGSRAH